MSTLEKSLTEVNQSKESSSINVRIKDWQEDVHDTYDVEIKPSETRVDLRVKDEKGNVYDVLIEAQNGAVRVVSYVAITDEVTQGLTMDEPVAVVSMAPDIALVEVMPPLHTGNSMNILSNYETGEIEMLSDQECLDLKNTFIANAYADKGNRPE